jgi:galactonate dehydratase
LHAGPIEAAANIQFAASIPNFLILESIKDMRAGIFGDLLDEPLTVEDGYVVVPTTPGLGVELNEELALAHPYEKDNLHLMVADEPVQPGPY